MASLRPLCTYETLASAKVLIAGSVVLQPVIARGPSRLCLLVRHDPDERSLQQGRDQLRPFVPRRRIAEPDHVGQANASTVSAIIESLDANKRPHLVGGTEEVMDMLRRVQDLKEDRQSTVPDFFGFDKWQQVVGFARGGEGGHLISFVNLVGTRGERQLMWALNRTVDEEKSDVVISTAHKAKGREWTTVTHVAIVNRTTDTVLSPTKSFTSLVKSAMT